ATAASCVPVALTAQSMYGTSVGLEADAVLGTATVHLKTPTGMLVLRIREPANGPALGYLIDDGGTPTLVVQLALYMDAPDMDLGVVAHDLHSKPLTVTLRGALRFLPDGRFAIALRNVADVPIVVTITGTNPSDGSKVTGTV